MTKVQENSEQQTPPISLLKTIGMIASPIYKCKHCLLPVDDSDGVIDEDRRYIHINCKKGGNQ